LVHETSTPLDYIEYIEKNFSRFWGEFDEMGILYRVELTWDEVEAFAYNE
jgi:hypothetical protein